MSALRLPYWVVTILSPLPRAPLWAWGGWATRLGLAGLLPTFGERTSWLESLYNQSHCLVSVTGKGARQNKTLDMYPNLTAWGSVLTWWLNLSSAMTHPFSSLSHRVKAAPYWVAVV